MCIQEDAVLSWDKSDRKYELDLIWAQVESWSELFFWCYLHGLFDNKTIPVHILNRFLFQDLLPFKCEHFLFDNHQIIFIYPRMHYNSLTEAHLNLIMASVMLPQVAQAQYASVI